MENKKDIRQLLSAYYDGEVSLEEKKIVEEYLAENTSSEFVRFQSKLSDVVDQIDEEKLSPDFETKMKSRLRKSKESKMNKQVLTYASVFAMVILVGTFVLNQNLTSQIDLVKNPQVTDHPQTVIVSNQTEQNESAEKIQQTRTRAELTKARADSSQIGFKGDVLAESEMVKDDVAMNKPIAQLAQVSEKKEMYQANVGRELRVKVQTHSHSLKASQTSRQNMMFFDAVAAPMPVPVDYPTDFNTEEYDRITENVFKTVLDDPLSTFSIDVDTASYSNVRRYLNQGQLPPKDAVRIEEMINYFSYDYPKPQGDEPFSITADAGICPWNPDHQLLRVGLKGQAPSELPPSNLVFLLDVSGSMNNHNKLPLLKKAMKMMVHQLGSNERVAIVVYAGAAGEVLESTPGDDKQKILNAIDRLSAGGSTAGGAGIKLAYKIAKDNFIKGGNNRVILATDGDFNVGVSSTGDLTRLIEDKRNEGTFLTVLGFGTGNTKDSRMEQLANKGNGNYYYIDTEGEAKKVLVSELGSTLFAIAKDVKIQIEFNPNKVKAYRLVGYETRMLNKEDFNDDKKDAGELGAGHTVTALYELVPASSEQTFGSVDPLKYIQSQQVESDEWMTVKLRYKKPDEDTSQLITKVLNENEIKQELSDDFQFAAAVAEFGMILRQSKFKAESSYVHVIESAKKSKGKDSYGYRQEFIDLVEKAQELDFRSEGGIIFKQ